MNHKLVLAYTGSEAVPFVKVGGLGDVLGALPKEMARRGHESHIFLPLYQQIDREKFNIRPWANGHSFPVALGPRIYSFSLWFYRDEALPNLTVWFIENHHFFNRPGPYLDLHGNPFGDEGERWLYFQKAVLEAMKLLQVYPHILHVNDFHTALIPALKQHLYQPFFQHTRTVLTLHNVLFHGVYDLALLPYTDLPENLAYPAAPLEFYGKINFLKAGLAYADLVNTVSPRYAQELLHIPGFSYGLHGMMNSISHKFSGILNGADYDYWNPETDTHLTHHYSAADMTGKWQNRRQLLDEAHLEADENTMVLGIVARMTEQKGFQLMLESWSELLQMPLVIVMLASGDKRLEHEWSWLAKEFPEKLYLSRSFDEKFAHLIQAGADLFLMPSQFEPCGLSQIYSLKYGTPPLAHATGGLADTISDDPADQTGYLFKHFNKEGFLWALQLAMKDFSDKEKWTQIQQNGMKKDFSWAKAADNYSELYQKVLTRKY
jgi:starch synthase